MFSSCQDSAYAHMKKVHGFVPKESGVLEKFTENV